MDEARHRSRLDWPQQGMKPQGDPRPQRLGLQPAGEARDLARACGGDPEQIVLLGFQAGAGQIFREAPRAELIVIPETIEAIALGQELVLL
jgi:hypothetical protein